ncbi:MAG: MarR family winged helix-turn-helix transcriptional regulator [Beutenbergiaceae bacterium]
MAETSSRQRLLEQLAATQQTFALTMARNRLEQLLNQHLSAAQLHALVVLDTLGDQPAGELARQLRISPATVTGLVDRLVRDGYAERHPDPHDGRSRLIHATDGGQQAWRQALFGPSALDSAVLANLSEEDLQLLIRASTVVRSAVANAAAQQPASAEGGTNHREK